MGIVNEQTVTWISKLNGKTRSKAHLLTGTDVKINQIIKRSQRHSDNLRQVSNRNQQTQRGICRKNEKSRKGKKEASIST